ncbi:MAG TPA: GSU2403 family nucleotidyltransferase fold protein [Steroidobacteraceae bacterium]
MEEIDLAAQTLFAELLQRTLDAEFDAEYRENGRFTRKRSKDREYWHYQWREGEQIRNKYVGPVNDASITARVERFSSLKDSFKRRQTLVRALEATGLPAPDPLSGRIVEAFWKAGFFRLRGVLVGTLAFQTYAGLLGVRLGRRPLMTQDADFAQFWGISENVGESIEPPLDVLRTVDESFKEVPHVSDAFVSTRYRNGRDYLVDFLTPNRGSEEHQGKPARMKVLRGAGAEPLRHLDFLIHEPEHSVLLHGGGVPVTVPRAERFAVHKLIVAVSRVNQAKSVKDIEQAGILIDALAVRRPAELAESWRAAWSSGKEWRRKLQSGRARLPAEAQGLLTVT